MVRKEVVVAEFDMVSSYFIICVSKRRWKLLKLCGVGDNEHESLVL